MDVSVPSITEELLFPSPMWWTHCNFDLEELSRILYELKDENPTMERSNVGGYQSQDFDGASMCEVEDELGNLSRYIRQTAIDIYKRFNAPATTVKFANIWFNINGNGGDDYNVTHTHPGSVLSGAFYVKAPEDSGRITFCRDHHSSFCFASCGTMEDFAAGYDDTPWMWNQMGFPPVANRLMLFPSWLPHKVETGKNKSDRISISFNFIPEPIDKTQQYYGKLKKHHEC
tara:strand:- start:44145 stop:44834 length:690 start_codon:yes stop_codon:yes gene_type:complete